MGRRDKRRKGKETGSKAKKSKAQQIDSDEDLDLILEEYTKSMEEKSKVVQSDNVLPTPRVNGSFILNPNNDSEAILFGGEYRHGEKVYYYSDLFKYNLEKMSWKKITSQTSPKPRSSHQMVACSTGKLVLFGGEFGTPSDTKFLHHRDCWLLDPKTMSWEHLEGQNPPPRSGHRMAAWRSFVVLFGGFFDDGRQTKYLDDLWIMDCHLYTWTKVQVKGEKPSARSGFVFIPCEDGIILYGGYHVTRDNKGVDNGKCMNDMWILKLGKDLTTEAPHWEKVKCTPSLQLLSGCSACVVKSSLYLFGGIMDVSVGDEYINGVCENNIFTMDLSRPGQWRSLEIGGPLPLGRYNAMILSTGKDVYIYGGLHEVGDAEVCLDDIWLFKNGVWDCQKTLGVCIPELKVSESDNEMQEDNSDEESEYSSDTSDESEYASSEDSVQNNEKYEYSVPLPEESLKDYFARTQQEYLDAVSSTDGIKDAKKIRSDAFLAAQAFYKSFHEDD